MESKRYQVFVSSTYLDLKEERQAVIQALLSMNCIPAGMEMFPASDETAWQLIKRVMEGCDYYIVILGGRYGSTGGQDLSYTEREYDYAVELGLPILGFVHEEPGDLKAKHVDDAEPAKSKMEAFRDKVRSKICKGWTTTEGLKGEVAISLGQQFQINPREGWVRAGQASNPGKLNQLHEEIDRLKAQLEDVRTKPPEKAKALAQGDEFYPTMVSGSDERVPLTWDKIIETFAPSLLQEASERDLKIRLESTIEWMFETGRTVRVTPESFGEILIQLKALGIIEAGTKKRSTTDKMTYWKLTPYGETYVMQLMAIPRAGLKVSSPGGAKRKPEYL